MEKQTGHPGAFLAFCGERCPRCRKGKMFKYPMYRFDKLLDMHQHCQVCDLKFERETGFFYGAMYVSYAFAVALIVTEFILLNSILGIHDPNVWNAVILSSLILLLPVSFRYSRVLYIRLAGRIKFNPDSERAFREQIK
jgi:uncharacterized protein (DUF983 family)